jgi:hypothetical protein
MGLDTKTYWLTDRQSQCDFDFELELSKVSEVDNWQNNWEEMTREELDCAKKTPCVIRSHSEAIINPLPGYD